MRDQIRFPGNYVGLDRYLLRISALLTHIAHAKYRIADLQIVNPVANRVDDSGKIPPQNIGKLQI